MVLPERGIDMDTTMIIRVVAGVLAVAFLVVIIYRRKKTS
jgi:heme/copper-type cytochrome/quinol oxidase subunit 2